MSAHKTSPVSPAKCKLKLLSVETHEASGDVSLLVQVPVRGKHRDLTIRRELLADPNGFKKYLFGRGAPADLDLAAEIAALGDPPDDTPEVTVVRRALWDGRRFVNCFGEFGPGTDEVGGYRFDRDPAVYWPPKTQGTLSDYVEGLAEPLAQSPTLLAAFLIGLVPALMLRLGVTDESFCVAITGNSTTGKTLSARTALSVSTRATEPDLRSANMTHGRAGQLGSFSGTVLALGDIKSSREKDIKLAAKLQTLVFGITGGVTRETQVSLAGTAPEACVGLFCFEQAVVPFFEKNGLVMEDGDRVRILDLQVPSPEAGGIFELDPGSAKDMANAVEETLRDNYGVFLPYWVNAIGMKDIEELRAAVERFKKKFDRLVGPCSPLEARYFRCLGWVYAAGSLALRSRSLKIVEKKVFQRHFQLLIQRLRKTFNEADAALQRDVRRLQSALATKAKFPRIQKGQTADKKMCANGFLRAEGNRTVLYVPLKYVDDTIDPRMHDRVLREFEQVNAFIPGSDSLTTVVLQKGLDRARFLKFDWERLERMT